MRHGKGACAYRNGSRYFGQWYRGAHHGFGVFVSPSGEKYGAWGVVCVGCGVVCMHVCMYG